MANFRFGLMSRGAPDAKALRASARKAEDLGYYSVLLNDHYIGPGAAIAAANHPVQDMAPIPAAAVIAPILHFHAQAAPSVRRRTGEVAHVRHR